MIPQCLLIYTTITVIVGSCLPSGYSQVTHTIPPRPLACKPPNHDSVPRLLLSLRGRGYQAEARRVRPPDCGLRPPDGEHRGGG